MNENLSWYFKNNIETFTNSSAVDEEDDDFKVDINKNKKYYIIRQSTVLVWPDFGSDVKCFLPTSSGEQFDAFYQWFHVQEPA